MPAGSWEYIPLQQADVRGATLVTGLPSFGNVGIIAGRFLVEHLGLRIIAGLHNDALPPVGVAWQGVVTAPLQVFATPAAAGRDHERLLVLNSDIVLPTESMTPLAERLTQWAAQAGVRALVGLEGYPVEPPAKSREVLMASSWAGEELARRLRAQAAHATLTGFNAALLVAANRVGLPAVGLFAVTSDEEDARAAAQLLQVVQPLVPQVRLDADALLKRAEAVEHKLREDQQRHARVAQKLQEQVDRSYA
jgi:predicted ATP-grasp superfamily ATP-dependent carboligase